MPNKTQTKPSCILIAVDSPNPNKLWTTMESLEELSELADTAGLESIALVSQSKDHPHPATYIGKGKVDEVSAMLKTTNCEVVIADDELSPAQKRNLEKKLEVKVLDRTSLILDIFAMRAHTAEAKLQVELAQLVYLLPRLTNMWTHLSKMAGGIGSKGPGETQLETDKRLIGKRMTLLKKELKKVVKNRETMRQHRKALPYLTGALLGYTNAGKSTLLNTLTGANVFAENKLFATLDPTTRQVKLPMGETILISDTVGFVQKLPHQLVDAFMATLEELKEADFLLHVIDISHPKAEQMIQTTQKILKDLGIENKPQLLIQNKVDKLPQNVIANEAWQSNSQPYPTTQISATKKETLPNLLSQIESIIKTFQTEMTFHIPLTRMDITTLLHKHAKILSEDYSSTEAKLKVKINTIIGAKIMGLLEKSKTVS